MYSPDLLMDIINLELFITGGLDYDPCHEDPPAHHPCFRRPVVIRLLIHMAKSDCSCPRCTGQGRPEPEYGYDLDKVPSFACCRCEAPIGDEPYIHVDGNARFGGMSLCHERCWDKALEQSLSQKSRKALIERKKAAPGEDVRPPSRTYL